jgi:hypothetical protein
VLRANIGCENGLKPGSEWLYISPSVGPVAALVNMERCNVAQNCDSVNSVLMTAKKVLVSVLCVSSPFKPYILSVMLVFCICSFLHAFLLFIFLVVECLKVVISL